MAINDKPLIIYTANFGGYDKLPDAPSIPGMKFICFTDQGCSAAGWEFRHQNMNGMSNVCSNRYFKINSSLFFSDWTLYVDSNVILLNNPKLLLEQILHENPEAFFVAAHHSLRNHIHEELAECLAQKRISVDVHQQLSILLSDVMLSPLSENNIIFRYSGDKRVQLLEEKWWQLFNRFPYRDQLLLAKAQSMANETISIGRFSSRPMFADWFIARPHSDAALISILKYKVKRGVNYVWRYCKRMHTGL